QAWGIDELLRRLNGMFAFAIWDQHQEMLFLARDRCGKKPLYYCVDDDNVAFASTLECLLGLIDRTPEVSLESIAYFLTYLSVPAPHTVFKGISKLEPATFLTWRKGESPRLQ
ncbi:MAG: asparagine synthetase B, partial [Burkholderiales bacterium]|nr:asparagine synthetase B [Burkholderiales bacterium]